MQRSTVMALGLLLAGAEWAPLAGQTEVRGDLSVFSSYVWRGLSYTNKPVLQPAIYASIPAGNASVTIGGWASIDLGRYDNLGNDIAQSGGSSSFNFAELDPYAEVSFPSGKTTITAGALGYIYPNDENAPNDFGLLTSQSNTLEVYGKLGFDVPLSPRVSAYYDVDKIKGTYVEASLSHSLAAGEKVSIDLGALAGFSAGQAVPDDPLEESSNFAGNGLTHLDLSAGVPFSAGAMSVTPVLHFVINGDDRTKITSPTSLNSDVKLWGGVTLSWSKAVGPVRGP